jgi:hypothetical protein
LLRDVSPEKDETPAPKPEKPKRPEKTQAKKPTAKKTQKTKELSFAESMKQALNEVKTEEPSSELMGPTADSSPDAADSEELAQAVGQDVLSKFQSQLSGCWNVQAGSQDAASLIVSVRVDMNRDGTVEQAKVIDSKAGGNRAIRVAEENALRAVLDPRCQPFPFPQDQYKTWKTILLRFDPRGLVGP